MCHDVLPIGVLPNNAMMTTLQVEKMIASSPHNTATRNRGPRASAITPASGRKGKKDEVEDRRDEPRSTKKRGRKESHVDVDDDDDDEPEDKRVRRGKASKDDDAPRSKASRGGRGGRRKA